MLSWLFPGCISRKHYQQKDYSFYAKDFTLDNSALLQTDGVYISEQTDQHREVQKDKKLYKFYPGGQVNMIINDQNELNTTADYSNAFNRSNDRTLLAKRGTLFEGYYRMAGDRIVLQLMNQPLRQFYYVYAFLKDNQMVVVRSTHEGKGKMEDQYFNSAYQEVYHFEKASGAVFTSPNW